MPARPNGANRMAAQAMSSATPIATFQNGTLVLKRANQYDMHTRVNASNGNWRAYTAITTANTAASAGLNAPRSDATCPSGAARTTTNARSGRGDKGISRMPGGN